MLFVNDTRDYRAVLYDEYVGIRIDTYVPDEILEQYIKELGYKDDCQAFYTGTIGTRNKHEIIDYLNDLIKKR